MAKETANTPILDLDNKKEVRKHISQLKAGERVTIQRGGYSLKVGVPTAEQEEQPKKVEASRSDWLE